MILSFALKNCLVDINFASSEYVSFPKNTKKERVIMDDISAEKFYNIIIHHQDIRIKTAILMFLCTGFRNGEIVVLQWSNIDFQNNTITIEDSTTLVSGYGPVFKDTKTKTSNRTITIPKILIDTLKEYRKWYVEYQKEIENNIEKKE